VSKYFNSISLSLAVIFAWQLTAAAEMPRRQTIVVHRDQVMEFPLVAKASSVIIGNPEIADILAQSPTSIIVFGRKSGQTNILFRDVDGRSLANFVIDVRANSGQDVSVYYGTIRHDYSCTSECRKITLLSEADPQTNVDLNSVKLK